MFSFGPIKTKTCLGGAMLAVPLPDEASQDVPVDIGDDWPVSPQIKGALKSLPGVVQIEDLVG